MVTGVVPSTAPSIEAIYPIAPITAPTIDPIFPVAPSTAPTVTTAPSPTGVQTPESLASVGNVAFGGGTGGGTIGASTVSAPPPAPMSGAIPPGGYVFGQAPFMGPLQNLRRGNEEGYGVLPNAQAWFAGPGPQYFPGATVAGFNPMQQAGFGQALQGAQQLGQAGQQISPYIQQYLDTFGQTLGAGQITPQGMVSAVQEAGRAPPALNPWTQQVGQQMLNQLQRNFAQQTLPSIRANQTLAGQPGSSRQGIAEGLAASNLGQQGSQALANLYAQAYGQGLDYNAALTNILAGTYGRGLGYQADVARLGPQIFQTATLPGAYQGAAGLAQAGIGQAYQQQAQNQLQAEIDRWNYYQTLPLNMLNAYGALAGGNLGGQSVAKAGSGGGGFSASGALGGAAQGATVGSAFPPWGTLIGGAAGALIGGFSG